MFLLSHFGFKLSELLFQASEFHLPLASVPPNIFDSLERPLLLVLAVADVAPEASVLCCELVNQEVDIAILRKLGGALAA